MAKAKTQDEIVQELIDVVKVKKAEIAKAEKPKWLTNCSYPYGEENGSVRVNLNTVTQEKTLVAILADLLTRKKAHEEAQYILGSKVPFTWGGYTFDDWKGDIQTRLFKIQITDKKKELELLEARLDKLISPELKAKLELEEIQSILSK